MRCTRCDRWAVPQAVGRTPDGVLVFGWCLDCLGETGCIEVEVSVRLRGTVLPSLRELERASSSTPDRDREGHREGRARLVILVTAVLAAWGTLLLSVGVWLLVRPPEGPASPLGNGTPLLLLVGGAATTATALALGMAAFGRALFRSRRALRSIRWVAFLFAMAVLLVGVLDHVPRRDPYLVLAAASALAVAALARRLERRRAPRPFSPSPETTMEKRPNIGR
jgi:hypothetical protein